MALLKSSLLQAELPGLLALPEALLMTLLPFQLVGVARIIGQFGGRALLGDEMGLGKTLQALLVAAAFGKWLVAFRIPFVWCFDPGVLLMERKQASVVQQAMSDCLPSICATCMGGAD